MRHSLFVLLFIPFLCLNCGHPADKSQSDLRAFGAGAGKRSAVVVGAPNGLSGVRTDVVKLSAALEDTGNNFYLTVAKDENVKVRDVLDLTKQEVKDAVSLYWYFSGHGGNGVLLADDSTFTFKQVVEVIKEVRDKPLKRLVVMIDSCNSGSFVNGSSPIVDEDEKLHLMLENTFYSVLERDSELYDEALVLASSKKNESSADLGAVKGGAFTYSLRTTLTELREENFLATLQDLIDGTITMTQREGGHTPVYKAFPSEDVLSDYLFLYRPIE